ncbi:Ribosomal RNA-processing protein [Apis cerana cerana]|uniref:Ribosomal RNA-processing protein 8 n=1 Tax=Apis cerana cerana TaxID=94128 RepID=A0A2A3ED18_APICC|nr:Ribosomal RNA-processing protein [Apis cerana cerana]
MIKNVKKNLSNVKKTDKNISEKKSCQKKKLTDDEDKHKPTIIKNKNLKFKNKSTKNKLFKKIKQIYKNNENHNSINFLNSDIIKKIDDKKQNQKNLEEKNKISDQIENKINNNNKFIKKTKTKHTESEMKQQNNKPAKLNSILQKKQKQKREQKLNNKQHNLEKLLSKDNKQEERKKKKVNEPQSLRDRMMTKLRASRFRYLNETLYNNESSESKKYFKNDPDAFKAYHEGYKQQIEQWPLNPLDVIISSIKKIPKQYIIADFGCGEARLAATVPHKVHSFDFISLNKNVTACDVAHTPLLTSRIDVVVFCLSLMGTNLKDYIIEANRVLKKDGILKIAEVESRFEHIEDFIKVINNYGFKNTWKDLSHNLFYFLDFKKERDINNKNKLPLITLKPCLYKKR